MTENIYLCSVNHYSRHKDIFEQSRFECVVASFRGCLFFNYERKFSN